MRRDLGADMERARPRSHPNSYPAGHSNGSGFANGHRRDFDHAAFFYSWSSDSDAGSYAHSVRSSKPDAFLYSYVHRYADSHADSYHNIDAEFNSYCYVNFNADVDTHFDARST